MNVFLTANDICPCCGSTLNASLSVQFRGEPSQEGPQVGDFTICGRCSELLRWGPGMLTVKAGPKDLAELTPEEQQAFQRARSLVAAAGRCTPRPARSLA